MVGFNPCCVGSVASTRPHRPLQPPRRRPVSILVVLDRSRQRQLRARVVNDGQVSILVVLDRSRQPESRGPGLVFWRGFNPCCVGSVASTQRRPKGWYCQYGFQSLLCWIGRVNSSLQAAAGFACAAFQSLLCWIGRVNLVGRYFVSQTEAVFQSLLCWIGRVNRCRLDGGSPASSAFQSLLCWIGRVNPGRRPLASGTAVVSILVVLDRSRQRGVALSRPFRIPRRFNPCCVGSVASTGITVA